MLADKQAIQIIKQKYLVYCGHHVVGETYQIA